MKLLFENWRKFINEERVVDANAMLIIKPSNIHGDGIFAAERIPKDTDLGITSIRNGGNNWVIPPLGRWHNHSEQPTCYSVASAPIEGEKYTRNLFTKKDIEPGEEITVDYRLQPDMEQPGQWAINEANPLQVVTNIGGKALDARTVKQGVDDNDSIMTALGLGGFIARSPFQIAALTLGTLFYGNAKKAFQEWNSLPEDHPRKVAHKKYVQQCPNCHRLDGKSREWHEKNKGAIPKQFSTLDYFKDTLKTGHKVKTNKEQKKVALELMKMWLNK